jgi:hypothetical protein
MLTVTAVTRAKLFAKFVIDSRRSCAADFVRTERSTNRWLEQHSTAFTGLADLAGLAAAAARAAQPRRAPASPIGGSLSATKRTTQGMSGEIKWSATILVTAIAPAAIGRALRTPRPLGSIC